MCFNEFKGKRIFVGFFFLKLFLFFMGVTIIRWLLSHFRGVENLHSISKVDHFEF